MIFSYPWLKEFVPTIPAPEEVLRLLTVRAVEVEGLQSRAREMEGVVVGRIESVQVHPNADRLRVCTVDVGGAKTEQIVCGGTNLSEGMRVAVALIGARVRWHGAGELVSVKSTVIRGVESRGMICSSDEVGLHDFFPKKEEREVLNLSHLEAATGASLAQALGMDEVLLEIDNKSMTHRADLFSHVFMAREIAAVFDLSFACDMLANPLSLPKVKPSVQVHIDNASDCPRYMAIEMQVEVGGETPAIITQRLQACGMKSINPVVDITNYVMLEFGQPLHAFDADAVDGAIHVRRGRAGETLQALDHTEKKLSEDVLLIADEKQALGVAGIIGGVHSAITAKTTRIILEVANFDPVVVRRSAQAVGVRTESTLRFEKGLSPELARSAAARAIQLLQQHARGTVQGITDVYPEPPQPRSITLSLEHLAALSGTAWSAKEATNILLRLGMEVTESADALIISPPWFRQDLSIPEDIVEEVVRIHGIEAIPEQQLTGVLEVPPTDKEFHWVSQIRQELKSIGLTELYNYSFYGEALITNTQLVAEKEHIQILNPLSDELRYLRVSLLPRMLECVARNQFHADSLRLFEVGHVYFADREVRQLSVMVSDKHDAYRKTRGVFESLLHVANIAASSSLINKTAECEFWNAYAHNQALTYSVGTEMLGTLGEVDGAVLKNFDIKKPVAFGVLSIPVLARHASRERSITPLSLYPAIPLDLSLIVDVGVSWSEIELIVRQHAGALLHALDVFDVYSGSTIPTGKKSIAFHLVLQSHERTLEMKEIETWREQLVKKLSATCGAILRDS